MQKSQLAAHVAPNGQAISLLALLLLVDSLHFVFARALLPYFAPTLSSLFVMGVGALEVGLYAAHRRQLRWSSLGRHWGFFVTIGFLIAASTVLTYTAVRYIDAGTASMLGKMSILFSLGFGLLWLRERLNAVQMGGALLAVAGVFLITFQPGSYFQLGSLVVASTFMYALHTAIVKRYGGHIDFLNFFFFRLLSTTTFLLLFAVAMGDFTWPASSGAWPLLLLAGTVDVAISRSLYYLALRRLTMSLHAIVLTISPVATVLWALLLFGTFPGPRELLGGLAVLAGVLVATLYRSRAGQP